MSGDCREVQCSFGLYLCDKCIAHAASHQRHTWWGIYWATWPQVPSGRAPWDAASCPLKPSQGSQRPCGVSLGPPKVFWSLHKGGLTVLPISWWKLEVMQRSSKGFRMLLEGLQVSCKATGELGAVVAVWMCVAVCRFSPGGTWVRDATVPTPPLLLLKVRGSIFLSCLFLGLLAAELSKHSHYNKTSHTHTPFYWNLLSKFTACPFSINSPKNVDGGWNPHTGLKLQFGYSSYAVLSNELAAKWSLWLFPLLS